MYTRVCVFVTNIRRNWSKSYITMERLTHCFNLYHWIGCFDNGLFSEEIKVTSHTMWCHYGCVRACVRMCPCCILHMWCACLSSPPCVYTWENIIFGLFRCYMNEIKTDSHYTIWHAIYKKKATIILFTVKLMMFDGNLFMSIYTEMAWSLQRDDVPQQNKDTRGL